MRNTENQPCPKCGSRKTQLLYVESLASQEGLWGIDELYQGEPYKWDNEIVGTGRCTECDHEWSVNQPIFWGVTELPEQPKTQERYFIMGGQAVIQYSDHGVDAYDHDDWNFTSYNPDEKDLSELLEEMRGYDNFVEIEEEDFLILMEKYEAAEKAFMAESKKGLQK